jgi:hypothetical protein
MLSKLEAFETFNSIGYLIMHIKAKINNQMMLQQSIP